MAENLITGDDGIVRCWWPGDNDDYRTYHDEEWGVPLHDDRRLFEMLILEGAQAGGMLIDFSTQPPAMARRIVSVG